MSQLQKSASKASHAFCSHSRKLLAASLSAVFALSLAPAAMAENYWWNGASTTDTNYNTPANWGSENGTAYPGSEDGAMFLVDAVSKTVTFNSSYTPGWAWVNTGSLENPVIWNAPSSKFGMTTIWNIGLADNSDQTGALQIDSGLYTAGGAFRIGIEGKAAFTMTGGALVSTGVSEWGTTNATISSTISGGTIEFNGNGGNEASNPQASAALDMMNGSNIVNTINIAGGTVAVNGGDLKIGRNDADGTSTTIINISDKGVLSCGTDTTERWLKLGVDGAGAETINVNDGGTLAFWFITHTSTGTAKLKVNGGTLKFLGTTAFNNGSIDPYYKGETDSFTVSIEENGGTFDADTNISINKVVTGTGSLTKKGTGRLTFNVMPVFTGTLTVAEGAGSVILPAGATIEAGAGTDRRTLTDGTVEYFHGSVSSSSTLFTEGADATITLAGDTYLDIDETVAIGKLMITGSGNLHLSAGSAVVTATSLDIVSGATVQLASGTNLATGPLQTTSVTGAGTIVYDAVPDGTASDLKPDEAGYTQDTWTGTVWIQNCIYRTVAGTLSTDLSAYGNAGSRIKLTNAKMYFAQGMNCAVPVELANTDANGVARDFAIDLTNGYGNGASVQRLAKITGDGTFKTENAGGNEVVSIVDISDFSGKFDLATKIVVLGDTDGTVADEYKSRQAAGTTAPGAGTIVIPAGVTVSVPAAQTWSLAYGFVGAGTLKYTHPWQVGTSSLSNGDYWTGTVELASCVNTGTGSVAVYPDRMGNENSKIVFKGLAPGSSKGYFLSGSTSATIQLDGDVTISDGSSGATYSLGVLTGIGSFTGATSLGTACTFAFSAVSNYTGTISANSKSLVTIGTYMSDADVAVGTKLVSVDSDNAYVTLNSVTVTGGEPQTVATAVQSGNDGYGLYVTAVQRDVYWIGGASGNWSDTTAWALADGTPLNSYPQDGTQNAGDNVVFTNAAVVAIDVRPVITKMTLNADVTISTADAFQDNTYSGMKYLFVETIVGPGVLTMSNAVIAGHSSSRPFKIYSPVCIAEGTSNAFGCSNYVNYLYGNLSGSGYIKVGNGNWGGLSLQGDNSAFSGQFESTQGGTRNASNFSGAQASSALASWTISAQSQNGVNTSTYLTDNSTYYFGALNGYLQLGEKSGAPILEIGARDEDCECQLVGRHDDGKSIYRRYSITKVGNAKFTIKEASTQPGTIDIQSGTVVFPDDIAMAFYTSIKFSGAGAQLTYNGVADLSGYIANSSSAIVIDTDANATWATALAASNVGGLTKKGTGTLTLTAVPQYGGQTVVEAGELVVPAGTQLESLSGSGKLVVDLANTDATGVLFALGNIADGASYEVRNEPAALNTVRTDKGVIYYVGEPKTYVWVGPSGDDYNWSTLSNWSVNDATPMEPPTAIDIVQFSPDASVVVDAAATALSITAGGALTVTANYDLAVTGDIAVNGVLTKWGMASVSANGAITADSVAIGTGAVVALSGSDPTSLTLDVGSTSAYAIDDAASSNGYGAKYSVLGDGTLVLSGHGQVNAAGNQTVHVAEANTTNSFTGFLCGSMSLAKTGAGTLALFGNNTFTGDVAIEAGSIKLNTPLDLGDVRCDFDASNAGITYSANVLRWQDAAQPNNANAFLWTDTASGTNPDFVENGAIFNGKKVLYSDSFRMVEPNVSPHNSSFPKTTFFVMQNTEGGTQVIAGDNNDTVSPTRWTVAWRNYGYMTRFGNDGSSSWNSNAIWANGALATQGNNGGSSFGSNPVVLTIVRNFSGNNEGWMDSRYVAHRAFIGGSGKQAWAEYLSYTRELSFDEKAAVEQYLMAKWGIAGEYTALPKTANVTMKAGTTLDMGGLTQTVKSFSGAGTVVNGSLKTTGSLKVTGALTIPAVKGQTYELGAANLTLTAGETGAIVKIPDGAKAVGRLIVPHGWTVGADAACDVVVTDLPKNWNVRPQRKGDETDQWFIGPNAFVIHFR